MDYLNYGKQVQQKPQGFDQQKVQLSKEDFNFGDLNQQKTQPQVAPPPVEPQIKNELIPLFAIPVVISDYKDGYDEELEWIKNLDCKDLVEEESKIYYNKQTKDTFVLDRPQLANIREFIEKEIKKYVTQVMGTDEQFIITQSWINKNSKGESHHEHTHPNSMISGVWYPQINEKSAPIQFRNSNQRDVLPNLKRLNQFNSATFLLPMRKGELIIFPSNLLHSVPPNQIDEERISLSFNTWIKGNMGEESNLTYLPLDRCL